MERSDWENIKGCFSLTRQERVVVVAAVAVLAVGAAVKYWRASHAGVGPPPAATLQTQKR